MINKFKYYWTYQHDKFDHGFIGYMAGNIPAEVLQRFQIEVMFALIVPFLLGLGRELYNKYYEKKVFDWLDFAVTFALGIVGVGITAL